MLFRKIYTVGDKFEDKVRGFLSHYPISYAFIGGIGVILFWRGIWHTVDVLMEEAVLPYMDGRAISAFSLAWIDGPLSILVGCGLLLTCGLFVSSFIGNEIIISGLKHEKKMIEKAEDEILEGVTKEEEIKRELETVYKKLEKIQRLLEK